MESGIVGAHNNTLKKKNHKKRLIEFFVFKTESSSTPRASIVLIVKVKSQKTDIDRKKNNKETLHRFLPNIYIYISISIPIRACVYVFFVVNIFQCPFKCCQQAKNL